MSRPRRSSGGPCRRRLWIEDAEGKRYLDGAGGAIVVNVGHGDRSLVDAMAEQSARTSYVHGTVFTTEALESYADAVAPLLPLDDPRIYPVSGGSEAVETAIKLARAFHLARGEDVADPGDRPARLVPREHAGALDVGGKEALRRPYEPWLGRFEHVDAAYEYRCPNPDHPAACGAWHAERLDRAIAEAGPSTVAAFIAEPVAGATLAAAVPTDDYWPAVAEVCRRHGVLLIADEVMTGFGRTGRWFGVDHWGVRPDVVTAGKGSTSGYFPFGFAACSGEVFETVRETGFVHGFTWSHNGVGRGGRPRDAAAPDRGRPRRRERAPGGAAAEVALVGARGRSVGRRRPRDRVDGGRRARGRPDEPDAVRRARSRRPNASSRRPGTRGCSCTRARVTSTGATAIS